MEVGVYGVASSRGLWRRLPLVDGRKRDIQCGCITTGSRPACKAGAQACCRSTVRVGHGRDVLRRGGQDRTHQHGCCLVVGVATDPATGPAGVVCQLRGPRVRLRRARLLAAWVATIARSTLARPATQSRQGRAWPFGARIVDAMHRCGTVPMPSLGPCAIDAAHRGTTGTPPLASALPLSASAFPGRRCSGLGSSRTACARL